MYPVEPDAHEPVSGSLQEFLDFLKDRCFPRAISYLKENRGSIYKVLADLDKDALIEHMVPMSNVVLTQDGIEHAVSAMGFLFRVKTDRTILPVEQRVIESRALLSSSSFVDKELGEKLNIIAVQTAGNVQGKAFIRRESLEESESAQSKDPPTASEAD